MHTCRPLKNHTTSTWMQDGWHDPQTRRIPRMILHVAHWLPVDCGYLHRQTDPHCPETCDAKRKAIESTPATPGRCAKCGGEMRPGIAMGQTVSGGVPDFPDGEVVTLSAGGPGVLIDCDKCVQCGHSITRGKTC